MVVLNCNSDEAPHHQQGEGERKEASEIREARSEWRSRKRRRGNIKVTFTFGNNGERTRWGKGRDGRAGQRTAHTDAVVDRTTYYNIIIIIPTCQRVYI